MSGTAQGFAGFALVVALIFLRVPVAVAMGVVGAAGYGMLNGWPSLGFVMGREAFDMGRFRDTLGWMAEALVIATVVTSVGSGASYIYKVRKLLSEGVR